MSKEKNNKPPKQADIVASKDEAEVYVKIKMLEEKCQELHDVITELCHFTGQQRPIIKRGWKPLDPNEKQWQRGAKAVEQANKSWQWK
jgi:hypothetical protein